jgi:outer membrane lipoprotein-sorting protein
MARLLRSRSVLAAVIAAVALVAAVALAAGATTSPDLPPVAADRLIASSLAAVADRAQPVSGTVQTHIDLGIPQLPSFASASGPSGLASVLLSDQTFKVWRSVDGMRIAQLLPAAERDVIVTPPDAWIWDSDRFAAWHAAIPAGATTTHTVPSIGDVETVVSGLLARLEPYATVASAGSTEVAGRPAYLVRLTPSPSSGTLVDRVEVAIDASTRIPLRLQVFANGVDGAVVRIGYTSVSFDPFDASMLRFTPPAGATVHELHQSADDGSATDAPGGIPDVRWFGTGFDLVAAVSVPTVPKDVAPLFPFRGPIASADLVDRGDHVWVVAGLVPPDALAAVEPKLP